MSQQPKRVAIFGATGTIGDNALDIITKYPALFRVTTLTARDNATKLIALAKQHKPEQVVIANDVHYQTVRDALPDHIAVSSGETGLIDAAQQPCDIHLSAIIGFSALRPTMAAIEAGHDIALANKECLVAAGSLVMAASKQYNTTLLPVDSEHNALFQLWHALQGNQPSSVTLTASGGPFRKLSYNDMQHVTPAQAVAHPNWDMGAKISVDSATLMNKGLELIEALHLFNLTPEQLKVIVHPQSIMHCLIGMADGSHLAQCALPDMRTPLAHALHYPQRLELDASLDLASIGQLTFEQPDTYRFPCLQLAYDAMHAGASACLILNAANEIAVHAFLKERTSFIQIPTIIANTLEKLDAPAIATLDDVYELDHISRQTARDVIAAL